MNLLSTNIILGCIGIVLLFIISFLAVHTPAILQKTNKKRMENPPQSPPQQTEVEPVYYIVEKKRKRVKETYSQPKQIRFK